MLNSKTVALLFAMVSLGGMIAIPGLSIVPTTTAHAQIPDAGDIVNGVLDDVFGDDEEAADNEQNVEQPIDQEIDQEVDQSEENDQSNTNTQTQVGSIDQGIAQGIEDGDDKAKSSSESGDAKKVSTSTSGSGDAVNVNNQDATNDARLQQLQVQNVDQNNFAEFGDDTARQAAANVAIPIAVPINVQEELEEEEVEDDNGENGEEETFTVCVGPGQGETQELTAEKIGRLILDDVRVRLGECPSD